MRSHFTVTAEPTPDPIFSINTKFLNDTYPEKVNLGVGIYKDENGKSYTLPIVRKVENLLVVEETPSRDYLPITGHVSFIEAAIRMVLGPDSSALDDCRAQGVQGLAGTGSLRVALDYLKRVENLSTVFVPSPTWPIHLGLLDAAGFSDVRSYKYIDGQTNSLDFDAIMATLESAPSNSVIVFHVCAHNPTGVDPSVDQWKKLADVCQRRHLLPLMDAAYLGLVSGDVDQDCFPIRYFASLGLEMMVAVSFSKIMGLYNDRVGCLFWVAQDTEQSGRMRKQISSLIRHSYSNPPAPGVKIAYKILSDPNFSAEWHCQLKEMSKRIKSMRQKLYDSLVKFSDGRAPVGCFDHYIHQCGMFTFSGLSESMIDRITQEFHIYMLKNGRMNMCGLTHKNVEFIAKAILTVMGLLPRGNL